MGETVDWCAVNEIQSITAQQVAEAAKQGDLLAREVFTLSASYLGKGLSIVIDLFNPEVIVIGSIYARNEELMKPVMMKVIEKEALPHAGKVCEIKPAKLGEQIGDFASLSVAVNLLQKKKSFHV